ncbi:transcriptional regulator, PadR family [Geomicrobium sp. JCM 19037]|uniref:PadR family transcriptional regulator n=1 Tax=unclassified Geomicrobium TaxID=2628951 RepID=UPI00045F4888|nr:PadR family transcriptional regulator [Geomicrobium sp. JCM 19037]GAK06245.1 transcriptional regulator, PadR family [Geomicrobium sp. JCM 19037]
MSLKHGLLGLLSTWEASGYDIKQEFDGFVSVFWHSNLSQIYPELAKLETNGWIQSRLVPQVGKPDKKLYQITAAGKEELVTWLSQPPELPKRKDTFLMQTFFSDQLSTDEALFQLQTFGRKQREKIDEMEKFLNDTLQSIRTRQAIKKRIVVAASVYTHAIEQEKLYLAWVKNMMVALEKARSIWDDDEEELTFEEFDRLFLK